MNLNRKTPLTDKIISPNYLEKKINCAIVHIGLGAFHRAHQAVYMDKLMHVNHAQQWGICASTIRTNHKIVEQLRKQDYRYTVAERYNDHTSYRVVGSIREAIFAGNGNSQLLIKRLTDETIKIVTLTITEKAYHYNMFTQQLDWQHPDIQHDSQHPHQPCSTIGVLASALKQRYDQQLPGLSLLSCDNMPNNGQILQQALLQFIAKIYPEISQWVKEKIDFPSCMVDRIVPAIKTNSLQMIATAIGAEDKVGIACETFSQWVIEDRFSYGRPALEQVGVQFVNDISPFETMKLRMLNGSHSMLAYLGALADYDTVADAMAQHDVVALISHYMLNEAAPTINNLPDNIDLNQYGDELIQRFKNTALQHHTQQIAMDGSQKLPQRLVATVQALIAQKKDYSATVLAIAAWIRYLGGKSDSGQPFAIHDPLAEKFSTIYQKSHSSQQLIEEFLALEDIFPKALSQHPSFRQALLKTYQQLVKTGAKQLIKAYNQHKSN